MSEREMVPLDGELRDLIEAERASDSASSSERSAIRRRIMVSVGLAIGGAGGTGGVGGASAASGSAGASGIGGSGVATAAGGSAAGKVIAGTIAVLVATGGASFVVHELRNAPTPPAAARVATAQRTARTEHRTPEPATPTPVPEAAVSSTSSVSSSDPRHRIPRRSVVAPITPSEAPPRPEPTPEHLEPPRTEAAMVGEMSRALVANDAARVLVLAAEHERVFAHGTLAEERDALRIDALLALGRTREARERASRFRARYPGSLHVARIERAIASSEVTP